MTLPSRKRLYEDALFRTISQHQRQCHEGMCVSIAEVIYKGVCDWNQVDWRKVESLPEFRLLHPNGSGDRNAWYLEDHVNCRLDKFNLRCTILAFCIAICE